MTDAVTIWNLALSAVGGRSLISSPVEKSREAELCRLHYPSVRDTILKSASWPCASSYARLARVGERDLSLPWDNEAIPPQWRFSYGYPADLLAPRYSVTYARFAVGQKSGVSLFFSNEENFVLHYTARVENVALFDQGLFNAVVAALAAKLCVPLSGKDSRARALRDEAIETVLLARTEIANESEDMQESLPSWIQVRGLSMVPVQSRFIWPYEDISMGVL